jgi:hypothetical protein
MTREKRPDGLRSLVVVSVRLVTSCAVAYRMGPIWVWVLSSLKLPG